MLESMHIMLRWKTTWECLGIMQVLGVIYETRSTYQTISSNQNNNTNYSSCQSNANRKGSTTKMTRTIVMRTKNPECAWQREAFAAPRKPPTQ